MPTRLEIDLCSETSPHPEAVQHVSHTLPKGEEIDRLAELFKVFADYTRLKIICALLEEELCVCDLCELLQMNQSAISHQLRVLKSAHLVKYRRQGKQVFYSLDDDHIVQIISQTLAHIHE